MRLAIITPVGPGHEKVAKGAIESVRVAIDNNTAFSSVVHVVIDDSNGERGRSKARNVGMVPADWYFFLDADDRMQPDALNLCRFDAQAVFGALLLPENWPAKNVYPCGWREIALHGSRGTLNMGFFCRADVARRLKFNETMDAGEDYDFYLRLDNFIKIDRPLVEIGYGTPSAVGPRGYTHLDWCGVCNDLILKAVEREPAKYDLRGDAVLAETASAAPKPIELPAFVP